MSKQTEKRKGKESEVFNCKIGDFGLATSIADPKIEEGDSRYLDLEFLKKDKPDLVKADVFSLGISIYELVCFFLLKKSQKDFTKSKTTRYNDKNRQEDSPFPEKEKSGLI